MVEQPMWQQRVGQYCRRGAEVGLEALPQRRLRRAVDLLGTPVQLRAS
jgi:hypothetical protein